MWYGFVFGLLTGALLCYWRGAKLTSRLRKLPKNWPIRVRPLLNSRELKAWLWLCNAMFDCRVLIKVPVTRFLVPTAGADAARWFKILNEVYCTFVVCDMDGKVVGCVDVTGAGGRTVASHGLKRSLLAQCDLRYWVVDPARPAHLEQIRADFFGEADQTRDAGDSLRSQFECVRDNLLESVSRQRSGKGGRHGDATIPVEPSPRFEEARLATEWERNSFLAPLDSRAVPLESATAATSGGVAFST